MDTKTFKKKKKTKKTKTKAKKTKTTTTKKKKKNSKQKMIKIIITFLPEKLNSKKRNYNNILPATIYRLV